MIQTITDAFSGAQVTAKFPRELRELPQLVLWRGEDRSNQQTGEVKVSKVPIDPHTPENASTTDPRTWRTFEDCCKALPSALEAWGIESSARGGLGFVLTANDPYAGIDLDHCRNPETGEIKSWARQMIIVLKSYTKVSPSGTGLRIFAQGRLSGKGQKRGDIEVYDRKRFLTVTGDHLPGTSTTIKDRQTVIEGLYTSMDLLAKALNRYGEKCSQLFAGDTCTYKSTSEFDLGLYSMAAHVGASDEQIDALVRLSGLYREKWDEMHGDQTYGQMTSAKALEGKGDTSGSQRSAKVADVVCLATVQAVTGDLRKPRASSGQSIPQPQG